MNTLEDEWRVFAGRIGLDAPDVGETQRTEMRRAFFPGAWVAATQAHRGRPPAEIEAEAEAACLALMSEDSRRAAEGVIAARRTAQRLLDGTRRSKGGAS